MANLSFNDVQSRSKGVKTIHARLRILGNTTPANGTFSVVAGDGVVSLTRTGTGAYRITLSDKYVTLIGAHFTVLAATAIDLVPQLFADDVAGATPYVDFKMLAAAVATDTANAVTQDVFVTLVLKNTSSR